MLIDYLMGNQNMIYSMGVILMSESELLILKSMSQTNECQKMISELMNREKQLMNYIDVLERKDRDSIVKCPYCHELFSTTVGKKVLNGVE